MSRGLYILLFQRKLHILFSIFFLIFWNSINLAYVLQLGNEDLVSDYVFTSQRESHSLPDTAFFLTLNYHSGYAPFSAGGRRVESTTKFSKRECLAGPQLLEEDCWDRGGGFSGGGCNFHIKII